MAARRKLPAPAVAQAWNRKYPIGAEVLYWPWTREGEGRRSRTRSQAWVVGDDAVVLVEGKSGGIALTHVEPIPADDRQVSMFTPAQEKAQRETAWQLHNERCEIPHRHELGKCNGGCSCPCGAS